MLKQVDLARFLCRPACEADTADVMEFTRTIWGGNDYIPYVWEDWLVDYRNYLVSVQYGMHVIGIAKLSRFYDDQWWLEGLRVDPAYQGKGIARHIFEYMLNLWGEVSTGVVRLYTSSKRIAIHKICARFGFTQIIELIGYKCTPITDEPMMFTPIQEQAAAYAFNIASQMDIHTINPAGTMNDQWKAGTLCQSAIRAFAQRPNCAWWWRGERGLLFTFFDYGETEAQAFPYISYIACRQADLPALLHDFRAMLPHIAGNTPYGYWAPPVTPWIQSALAEAGYQPDWEDSVYLFEKKHKPL